MYKYSSAKYYQKKKKKKKTTKKPCKRYQSLSKTEKENIVMNGTKSSHKMKSKSWLTIEKIF